MTGNPVCLIMYVFRSEKFIQHQIGDQMCFKECTLFYYVPFIGAQWTAVGRREGGKEGGRERRDPILLPMHI